MKHYEKNSSKHSLNLISLCFLMIVISCYIFYILQSGNLIDLQETGYGMSQTVSHKVKSSCVTVTKTVQNAFVIVKMFHEKKLI
jgi:hypothetical protein